MEAGSFLKESQCSCDQTTNKDNPSIQNYDLSSWTCIDWDEVEQTIGEQPYIGGQWDGETVWGLRISFNTCAYKGTEVDFSTCTSFKEINESLLNSNQFVSFVLPSFNFDTTDFENPVKTVYRYVYYNMSPQITFRKDFYFSFETVKNDKGWILEDFDNIETVRFSREVDTIRVITESNFAASPMQSYLVAAFLFEVENVLHYRSYIKIQELFANVGGILKIILIIMTFLSRYFSEKLRNLAVVEAIDAKMPLSTSNFIGKYGTINSSSIRVSRVSAIRTVKTVQKDVGFFSLIAFSVFNWQKDYFKKKEKRFNELCSKIDVVETIKRQQREENNSET